MMQMRKLLLVFGVAMVIGAVVINPIAPLLTLAPVTIVDAPASLAAELVSHMGWVLEFRETHGVYVDRFGFYISPGPSGPEDWVFSVIPSTSCGLGGWKETIRVVDSGWHYWDLPNDILLYASPYSFCGDNLFGQGYVATTPQAPPSQTDIYDALYPEPGSIMAAFQLYGKREVVTQYTLQAKVTYSTMDFSVSATDKSIAENATVTSVDFVWGDGSFTGGQAPGSTVGHTYSTAGTYSLQVVAYDNLGHTDSVTQPVTVPSNTSPPTVELAASYCWASQGLVVSFDASGSISNNPIVSYEWDFGIFGAQGTGQQTTHSYSGGGTYMAKLTIRDDKGNVDFITSPVNVNAGADFNGCASNNVTIDSGDAFDTLGSARLPLFVGLLVGGIALLIVRRRLYRR